MAEQIVKVSDTEVDITPEPEVPTPTRLKLRRLRQDLQQAKGSLVEVRARHDEEKAPIIATIDRLQNRYDIARALITEE